jgi:hypothetical protein
MIGFFILAASGLAVGQPAPAADPVHQQVQAFIDVIQGGEDFANSEFKAAVKPADVARLQSLSKCDLDSVRRSESGSSAIVLFTCQSDGRSSRAAVMMMFEGAKTVSIMPTSFVQVPERG